MRRRKLPLTCFRVEINTDFDKIRSHETALFRSFALQFHIAQFHWVLFKYIPMSSECIPFCPHWHRRATVARRRVAATSADFQTILFIWNYSLNWIIDNEEITKQTYCWVTLVLYLYTHVRRDPPCFSPLGNSSSSRFTWASKGRREAWRAIGNSLRSSIIAAIAILCWLIMLVTFIIFPPAHWHLLRCSALGDARNFPTRSNGVYVATRCRINSA